MSRPSISTIKLNEHLDLSECHPDSECQHSTNWWLYDKRAGMNIGMRTLTRDDALVEAIEYWAERAIRFEGELKDLQKKVHTFVGQVVESREEDEE